MDPIDKSQDKGFNEWVVSLPHEHRIRLVDLVISGDRMNRDGWCILADCWNAGYAAGRLSVLGDLNDGGER